MPAADDNGQSDPFIRVWDTTEIEKKTSVIEDNNNPLFYETLELIMEVTDMTEVPPFILDIYDKDTLSNDFIARAIIPFKDASTNSGEIPSRPKWHKCRMTPSSPEQGEVLVSFSIVDFDFNFSKIPQKVDLAVKRIDFELEINVLGLRNL